MVDPPSIEEINSPVESAFHILSFLPAAAATKAPSGEKVTSVTFESFTWPRTCKRSPVLAENSRTEPCRSPTATTSPFADQLQLDAFVFARAIVRLPGLELPTM